MKEDSSRDALVQEARELLVAMEAALLRIESEGVSKDAVNAIFRAAHTIKGSAGLFAFDSIVSFTHLLENVFDKVRNGILQLDDAMMSLLLNCGDYMSDLVDAIALFQEHQDPDPERRADLEASLNQCLGRAAQLSPVFEEAFRPTALPHSLPAQRDVADEASVANAYWHISLRLSPDVLRDGSDPLSCLNYLQTLGRIAYLHVIESAMPAAAEMDPESCYLGFELGFESTADAALIESAFDFIREDGALTLLPPHASLTHYRHWLACMPERQALTDLLLKSQAVTPSQWLQLTAEQTLPALEQNTQNQPDQSDQLDQPGQQQKYLEHHKAATEADGLLSLRPKTVDDKKNPEQKFIKVEVSKLDELIDLVGELVIAGAGASLVAKRKKDLDFEEATQHIAGLVEQLRETALTLRMVQINEVFQRFPRVVRDMSREIGKNIELVVNGAETELDKSMVEKIADPLMHIVRNAMDHGIESADVRRQAGKPETGVLQLNARHQSGSVVIEVIDDGHGLNKEKILAKAIEKNFISPDTSLSEKEIYRLIFEPGFSTADQVTALSGRGVGMDVVKRNIDSLHGEVEVFSKSGQGTMVRIRLPLTLAIISGFQVVVGGSVFVIALDMVVECINLSAHQVQNHIVSLRDEPLPFIPLRELFDLPQHNSPRKSLVVVQQGQMRVGLLVDQLMGECQAVIKPLGKLFGQVKGLSGSTILGDGRVALILDVPYLISYVEKRAQRAQSESSRLTVKLE